MRALRIPQRVKERLADVVPGTPTCACLHCGKSVHVTRELVWSEGEEGASVQGYVTVAVECADCRSAA
jgi:hypothetical protein